METLKENRHSNEPAIHLITCHFSRIFSLGIVLRIISVSLAAAANTELPEFYGRIRHGQAADRFPIIFIIFFHRKGTTQIFHFSTRNVHVNFQPL
jgi:hypothetical protein